METTNNNSSFFIRDKEFQKFIDKEIIENVVIRLANRINNDYNNRKVFFLVVLKGAVFFASDLLRRINLDCELEFIRANSYGDSMKGSNLNLDLGDINIKEKDIIIVEDIIDTGETLNELIGILEKLKASSVEAVTLLSKPEQRKTNVEIKYIGIEIPSDFVIGYGMDFAQEGRQLADIYALKE